MEEDKAWQKKNCKLLMKNKSKPCSGYSRKS